MIKKIAILASGGNSPAMNNAIITLVRKAKSLGISVELIYEGYKGLLEENFVKSQLSMLSYFYANGSVIIGTSRYPKFTELKVRQKAKQILNKHKIDCLFVIGGDGSYKGAEGLAKLGIKVICLPGTIDNDVRSTVKTIGFSTALNQIVTSIDNIRNSFDSHCGIALVEVMGRRFPDLSINAAIATQAEGLVTCDNVLSVDDIVKISKETWKNKHRSCIIVVSEKVYGYNGLPTLAQITKEIKEKTNRLCRTIVLGYIQRGGVPSAEDRILASRLASFAIDQCIKSEKNKSYTIDYLGAGKIVANEISKSLNLKVKETNKKVYLDFLKYNKF